MKHLFTIVLFLTSMHLYSQSFAYKGKTWHVLELNTKTMMSLCNFKGVDEEYDLCIGAECDTTIAGTDYLRVTKDGSTYAIIREENGKVYIFNEPSQREYLLYDFTLNVGDTFWLDEIDDYGTGAGKFQCTVYDVTYEMHGDKRLKCITFTSIYHHDIYDITYPAEQNVWKEEFGGDAPICQPRNGDVPGRWTSIIPYITTPQCGLIADRFDWNGFRGQQLVLGEDVTSDIPAEMRGRDNLNYEFTGPQTLHIYGTMWTSCNPNQYIYCSSNGERIDIKVVEPEPLDGGVGAYKVDLYFNGFFIEGKYYILTDTGEMRIIYNEPASISSQTLYKNKNHMYNLNGNPANIPNGIYIQNGKKYIAKQKR